jgi:hypothetical protein
LLQHSLDEAWLLSVERFLQPSRRDVAACFIEAEVVESVDVLQGRDLEAFGRGTPPHLGKGQFALT